MKIRKYLIFVFVLLDFVIGNNLSALTICVSPPENVIVESNLIVGGKFLVIGKDVQFKIEDFYKGQSDKTEIKVELTQKVPWFSLAEYAKSLNDKNCILIGTFDNSKNTLKISWKSSIWPYGKPDYYSINSLEDSKKFIETFLSYVKIENKNSAQFAEEILKNVVSDEKIKRYAILAFLCSSKFKTAFNDKVRQDLLLVIGSILINQAFVSPEEIDLFLRLAPLLPRSLAIRYFMMVAETSKDTNISKDAYLAIGSLLNINRSEAKQFDKINKLVAMKEPELIIKDSQRALKLFDSEISGIKDCTNMVLKTLLKKDNLNNVPDKTESAKTFWNKEIDDFSKHSVSPQEK